MRVKKCINCGSSKLSKVNERVDENGILECAQCGMLMVEELNDDTESLYTSDYFQKDEGTKFGYADYLSSPVANIVGKFGLAALFVRPGSVHLDLGAADGSLMEVFSAYGYDTHGLEISKDAVKIAQDKGLDMQYSNLKGFPEKTVRADVITAYDLLEHSDAPLRVMQEVYKNLNKDGFFVFSTLSVKKTDPEDYWFNNSLEHYAYFTEDNLKSALEGVFGEGNVCFREIINNGIAEFWGFAKKGTVGRESQFIESFASKKLLKSIDEDEAFYLSLFYNQASLFKESQAAINAFTGRWSPERTAEASFFLNYYQGSFVKALEIADSVAQSMPVDKAVYWQALSDVRQRMQPVFEAEAQEKTSVEFEPTRQELRKTKLELTEMVEHFQYAKLKVDDYENSRYIAPVIKLRNKKNEAVTQVKKLKHVKHGIYHNIKKVLPEQTVDSIRARRNPPKQTLWVENEQWKKSAPLISVIIPYFNRKDVIDETVDSLAKQSFIGFETILIDDGSTETGTKQKLAELKKHPLNMKIVQQANQGVAQTRNNGIELAKGRYIICLDSDDILDPLYIEKMLAVLEVEIDYDIATSHVQNFGVNEETRELRAYDPKLMLDNNLVTTAAMFRRTAWEDSPGYTSDLGYEDWEFWLGLAERGHWARLIPEHLFVYRTATSSRFIDDRSKHTQNIRKIKAMHPDFQANVKRLVAERQEVRKRTPAPEALANLNRPEQYSQEGDKPRALVTMPWMTFGGAETLMLNFCSQLVDDYDITFMTGHASANEWHWRFAEISNKIYHLANLYEDESYYVEFISNYIKTRNIQILHIVHNSFMLPMLPELKRRHPELKVVATMFNSRAAHFGKSVEFQAYIDEFSSDNNAVGTQYEEELEEGSSVTVIPNGVNCETRFKPDAEKRAEMRLELGLAKDDIATFFIGRLAEEKNPKAIIDVMKIARSKGTLENMKFIFIGDGADKKLVEKALLPNLKVMQYLGYKDNIEDYLQAADVFVLPSFIEGFPLSILEAMGSGVASVASKVGAVPDVIEEGETGMIVETPGSAEEFYEALKTLSDNPEKLDKMKKQSRAVSLEKYSLEKLGKNYKALYKKALK